MDTRKKELTFELLFSKEPFFCTITIHVMQRRIYNLITWSDVNGIAPLSVLFCNCPLLKEISFNRKYLLVWSDWPVITCLVRAVLGINHSRDFWTFRNCPRFTRAISMIFKYFWLAKKKKHYLRCKLKSFGEVLESQARHENVFVTIMFERIWRQHSGWPSGFYLFFHFF